MATFTLTGFAAHLGVMAAGMASTHHHALEKAARIVEAEAKSEIGHRQGQAGPFKAWEPLAETTIHGYKGHPGKADLGHSPPDYDPLLRDGGMRDSIQHVVRGNEAHVGSNDDKAVWQELGTTDIPARSFLGGAAFRKKNEVGHLVGHSVAMALGLRGLSKKTDI